jgi:hypothetical protein
VNVAQCRPRARGQFITPTCSGSMGGVRTQPIAQEHIRQNIPCYDYVKNLENPLRVGRRRSPFDMITRGRLKFNISLPVISSVFAFPPSKSLNDRLGGYDANSVVVDVFLTKVGTTRSWVGFLWEWELTPGINCAKKNKNLLGFNTEGPC